MPPRAVHDLAAWEKLLAEQPRLLLFKHSPICPISHRAHEEWELFVGALPDAATAFVDVIADRAVARGISSACGIAHASPQAILFVDGRARWNRSHDAITAAALGAAWQG